MNNGGTSEIRDDAAAADAVEKSALREMGKGGEDHGDRHHGKKEEGARGKAWAQTLAGAMAGAVSRAAVTPLDVAKIRLQLQVEGPQHARYRGTWHCLSSMVKAEGMGSLWRGHVASQMLSVSYCAIQFPVYEGVRVWIHRQTVNSASPTAVLDFTAGSVAGCVATFVTYPFDILRTRLAAQTEPKLYQGVLHGARHMISTGGPSSLYQGFRPALAIVVPGAGLSFMFYKGALRMLTWAADGLPGSAPTAKYPLERLVAGAIAGGATKLTLHPIDVIKKRLQISNFDGRQGLGVTKHHIDMLGCARSLIQHEGVRGFYKGLGPALIKAVPNTMIAFAVYDAAMAVVTRMQTAMAAAPL